jgi:hypothetical protein
MTEKRKIRINLNIKVENCSKLGCPFYEARGMSGIGYRDDHCRLADGQQITPEDVRSYDTPYDQRGTTIPDWCKLRQTPAYVYVEDETKEENTNNESDS